MEAQVDWLEDDAPSLSDCAFCRHRFAASAGCSAYPSGIPDRWLFSTDRHTSVQTDQTGSDVYQAERVTAAA